MIHHLPALPRPSTESPPPPRTITSPLLPPPSAAMRGRLLHRSSERPHLADHGAHAGQTGRAANGRRSFEGGTLHGQGRICRPSTITRENSPQTIPHVGPANVVSLPKTYV